MEEGLAEGVNELGCEKCLIAFITPTGDVMTGTWGMERGDLQNVMNAIQDDIIDRLVRANLDMWLERLEEDRAAEENSEDAERE
jgi:hypothetical protein